MLEGFAAHILNRYIGKYVENLNTDNLSIGLRQGSVELENLPLKKSAINNLHIPGISFKSGRIGKIILHIPSYKSINEPWVIEVRKLFIIVGPSQEEDCKENEEDELRNKEEIKQQELDAIEKRWEASHGVSTSIYSVWSSYSSSILTKILDNLQLKLNDVHIRYEDNETLKQPFACGMVIEQLATQTTDKNWVPDSSGKSLGDKVHKLLKLSNFSLYWDSDASMYGNFSHDIIEEKLTVWLNTQKKLATTNSSSSSQLNTDSNVNQQHLSFLLQPVNGEAKFIRNTTATRLKSRSTPRLSLDMNLEEISLQFSKKQYQQMLSVAGESSRNEKRVLYSKGRPLEPISNKSSRLWWKWAINIHVKNAQTKRQKCSKNVMINRVKAIVEYVKIYQQTLSGKVGLEILNARQSNVLEVKQRSLESGFTFDELQILRQIVFERLNAQLSKNKVQVEEKIQNMTPQDNSETERPKGWGWGSWLSGWGKGWRGEATTGDTSEESAVDAPLPEETDVKKEDLKDAVYKNLDEEELYEIFGDELSNQQTTDSFLKRDFVLLKLNFALASGKLALVNDCHSKPDLIPKSEVKSHELHKPFAVLEFQDVNATTEWRPRYSSYEMQIDLGGMFLRDLTSKESHFRDLVKPQIHRNARNKTTGGSGGVWNLFSTKHSTNKTAPVFSLLYETLPLSEKNQFSKRLDIVTAPLIVTMLPNLFYKVKMFFKTTDVQMVEHYREELSAAAKRKYTQWKNQARREIRQAVNQIMEGKQTKSTSTDSWAVSLDICAPEVVIPLDISNPDTDMVIANLGHMTFKNHNNAEISNKLKNRLLGEEATFDSMNEDEFVTPPDSPVSKLQKLADVKEQVDDEPLTEVTKPLDISHSRLSEKLFREKMYEKYQLHFADLQVLIVKASDHWEASRDTGHGVHHIVEKFTIDLTAERRLIATYDSNYPAVVIGGNMPHLSIHVSHKKMKLLVAGLDKLSPESQTLTTTFAEARKAPSEKNMKNETAEESYSSEALKARQLVCNFHISHVSVILEKEDASILSVFEIRKIEMKFVKTILEQTAQLSIHSMLLADVLQNLGQEFDLLFASHTNIKMDLGSGSMLDSGTTSPRVDDFLEQDTQNDQTDSMLSKVSRNLLGVSDDMLETANDDVVVAAPEITFHDMLNKENEVDLITIEVQRTKNAQDSTLTTFSCKFDSLDVILNCESWIAVLDFVQQLNTSDDHGQQSMQLHEKSSYQSAISSNTVQSKDQIEVVLDFHELNILLLRHVYTEEKIIGKKIGIVAMHDAQVIASLNDENNDSSLLLDVQGSVGNISLKDLQNHGKQVLSIGEVYDDAEDTSPSVKNKFFPHDHELQRAFTFSFQKLQNEITTSKAKQSSESSLIFNLEECDGQMATQQEAVLSINMASMCYMHAPRLVAEILALTDEAVEVTKRKMTSQGQEAYRAMAQSIMDKVSDYSRSIISTTDITNKFANDAVDGSIDPPSLFKLQIEMESPLIALPKTPNSYELLIANLGKISIQNHHATDDFDPSYDSLDILNIGIEKMNVVRKRFADEEKLTIDDNMRKKGNGPNLLNIKYSEGSTSSCHEQVQIVHDTSVKLRIVKDNFQPSKRNKLDIRNIDKEYYIDSLDTDDEIYDGPISDKVMKVELEATAPLNITFSKQAYEQVLKTLDNISFGGDIDEDVITKLDDKTILSRASVSSETSIQSTPKPDRHFKLPETSVVTPIKSPSNQSSTTTIVSQRNYTPISAEIKIPAVILTLAGNPMLNQTGGLVRVTLGGFFVNFLKETRYASAFDITLRSLLVEDMLKPATSPHRHIVMSYKPNSHHSAPKKTDFMSKSCPTYIDSSTIHNISMSTSVPSSNHDTTRQTMTGYHILDRPSGVFRPYETINIPQEKLKAPEVMQTSDSSEQSQDGIVDLVSIKAFLIDGDSRAYNAMYNRINRRIDIDFNSLDCLVNMETWVLLLDFFGIGTAPKKQYDLKEDVKQQFIPDHRLNVNSYYENQPKNCINSEIDFKVNNLSLTLNKDKYTLCKANVVDITSHIQLRDNTMGIRGQLGNLSLADLSPNGHKYRERFIFAGKKAIDFDIKKFDEPDDDLKREFDIRVIARMSSFHYVHTQRFMTETIAYLQHFQQLLEVIGRMNAAQVGQEISALSRRQARVKLDIKATSPVILIPESCHSDKLIVADLGHLTVSNNFYKNTHEATLWYKTNQSMHHSSELSSTTDECLVDVIRADLIKMDLFTAMRTEHGDNKNLNTSQSYPDMMFPSFKVVRDQTPLLKEKLVLKLQIERNLDKEVLRCVPDMWISGMLSSVYCTVDLQQYWLVRNMLDHNLGEPIPDFPQPASPMQSSNVQTVLTGSVYKTLKFDIRLKNVSIELLQPQTANRLQRMSLVKLGFIDSKLSFEAKSDQTKTTNLSCAAFMASDTRPTFHNKQASVFRTVLAQKTDVEQTLNQNRDLQFELHYDAGPDFMHLTALLVDMRVYLIFDWLEDVFNYIIENPAQEWSDLLKTKSSELIKEYEQVIPGQQAEEDPTMKDVRFKVNVTNTEFVVVEDCSRYDSDAVILRSTAVLQHAPNILNLEKKKKTQNIRRTNCDKLLICTLQSVEVFSCQLDQESNTALSIVDPVTINFEIGALKQHELTEEEINYNPIALDKNKLEIQVNDLHMRVSYNDMMLFLAIANSLPFLKKKKKDQDEEVNTKEFKKMRDPSSYLIRPPADFLASLQELGYSTEDISVAYRKVGRDRQHAANWLMENATQIEIQQPETSQTTSLPFDICKVMLNIDQVCVCLIDDCGENCDVPLAELALRDVTVAQYLMMNSSKINQESLFGKAKFILTGDYYNRLLSLWEPYIEPWRCSLKWSFTEFTNAVNTWNLLVEPSDRLDLTITSNFIDVVRSTANTWTTSYSSSQKEEEELLVDVPRPFLRKRQSFIPYVLRNLTGLPLKFSTLTAGQNGSNSVNLEPPPFHSDDWTMVMPGDTRPFVFEGHKKQRHKRSDQLSIHQICVKVGECQTLAPVTISKVGVYFRHATEEIVKSSSVYKQYDPIRVVFAVALEGSAQKIVTVRSSWVIRSKVNMPIQLQLIQPGTGAPYCLPLLDPGEVQYIPLHMTHCELRVKPHFKDHKMAYKASTSAISWSSSANEREYNSQMVTCEALPINDNKKDFKLSLCMKKKPFPSYEEVVELMRRSDKSTTHHLSEEFHDMEYIPRRLPGHTLLILPPLIVSNLLPCHLEYYFKDIGISGKLKPGEDGFIHSLHLSQKSSLPPLHFGCMLEGFIKCKELVIPHVEKTNQMRMPLIDQQNRTLLLNVRVIWRYNSSVKISVMAPYWVVNKTGLPLIFQQDGSRLHAAGQYTEHETARSMAPLLFSYIDRDLSYLCTMRLGKFMAHEYDTPSDSKYPYNTIPRSSPFCQSFSIDGGTCTRDLVMVSRNQSPNLVYHVGISVQQGYGRFSQSHIVTVAPRFLLVNMTKSHVLSFAQRHTTSYSKNSAGLKQHLSIIPGSSVVFHWSRVDFDRLLCIRLTKNDMCRWSGGFTIDKVDSFYINLRIFSSGTTPETYIFLRAAITLSNATYKVCLYDADPLSSPPPLRIDNLSEAPIVFRQHGVEETTEVSANSQCPYTCDEPCLPAQLQCAVKGGSENVVVDMNKIGSSCQLHYENYIYISLHSSQQQGDELVLEVLETPYDHSVDGTGQSIILSKKRHGNRRQLWRQNKRQQLVWMGLNMPNKAINTVELVLDIAEHSFGSNVMPLCIRPHEPSRESKQTWYFHNGRLCNKLHNLCVQARDCRSGCEVFLGSYRRDGITLPNQNFLPEKMINGSGILSLTIVRDGPTRVLRIVDIRDSHLKVQAKSMQDGWVVLDAHQNISASNTRLSAVVELPKGIGVSIVNGTPEEILYMLLTGVRIEGFTDKKERSLKLKVQNVQIDNQLFESRRRVVLYRYMASSNTIPTDPFISLRLSGINTLSKNSMYEIYKEFMFEMTHSCLILEEVLLLKLLQFFGAATSQNADEKLLDETQMDIITSAGEQNEQNAIKKRYFIDFVKVSMPKLQLSVLRDQLTPELKEIKQALSLTLIQFERAPVVLYPYTRNHIFESISFISNDVVTHLKNQLKGQAAKILGSVDFLGNPMGLLSDVKDGMSGLTRGNVQNLVKKVTHGVSNSTAKFAGTLSNQVGNLSMDQDYLENRRQLRVSSEKSGDHFVAGLQGLGAGFVGGLTSIVTQTVKGTQNSGAKGFFTGFGKGLVGTVTKPVAGVLDFASETASALRESSESQFHNVTKIRPPRCCHSFQGCLQCYSRSRADNQQFLYNVNHHDDDEWLYSTIEISSQDDLKLLITNRRVMLVKRSSLDSPLQINEGYSNMYECRFIEQQTVNRTHYSVQLTVKPALHHSASFSTTNDSHLHRNQKRLLINCHSQSVAKRASQQINHAKMLAFEQSETLNSKADDTESNKAFELQV